MKIYPFFLANAGCPGRCVFCAQQISVGVDHSPSPGEVFHQLDAMLPTLGDGEVAFYGGSFSWLPPKLQQAYFDAVAPFLAAGRVSGIRVSTRPDGLDAVAIQLLFAGGVTTVEIGCQSFSAEVLRRCGRGHSPQAAEEALRCLRRTGLRVGLQLMPGLPGGDRAEACYSMQRALDLRPDFLRIYPVVVLKGTGLESLFHAGGYRPLALEEAVDWCAELLWHARRAGIPVIRLGLQGTAALDSGAVVAAGPHHPAFGQLVRSRLWRKALELTPPVRRNDGQNAWRVHPFDLADAMGHRRENLFYLQRRCGGAAVVADPGMPRESLAVGPDTLSIFTIIHYP